MSDNESQSTIEADNVSNKKRKAMRKARQMLLNNNEKCIQNVIRVVVHKTDGSTCTINNPEVYKSQRLDTFIVFGELIPITRIEEMKSQEAAAMAINANIETRCKVVKDEEDLLAEEEINDLNYDLETDEKDLIPLDIDLVMCQTGVSRRKAVLALKNNNNDLVSAIMDLTN